jgi:hypothetical protein
MLVAVCLVTGAILVSFLGPNHVGQNSWLFKGAYAKYQGDTSIMGLTFNFSMRLEILDFNNTHALMSTSFKMQSSLGEIAENENATWVELSNPQFSNAFSECNMTAKYDSTIDFGELGTRSCTVYEYATDGPTIIVYVDKTVGWPLKIRATMSGEDAISVSIDINLIETNIPGLY